MGEIPVMNILNRVDLDFGATLTRISAIYVKKGNAHRLIDPDNFFHFTENSRQYYCIHYKKCLNFVVEREWDGFSCMSCRYFKNPEALEKFNVEDINLEVDKCLKLVGEIFRKEVDPRIAKGAI